MLVAPIAAFTMAGILLIYTRSSIRAAKLSVQRYREADGGQIDLDREARRVHGQLDKVDERAVNKEALLGTSVSEKFESSLGGE
jgi:hypothetical protein